MVREQTGIDPAKMSVNGNVVDESVFHPGAPPEALRMRYRIGASEPVLLTVARLAYVGRCKGYDRVVKTLPKIRDAVGPLKYPLVGERDDGPRIEVWYGWRGCDD